MKIKIILTTLFIAATLLLMNTTAYASDRIPSISPTEFSSEIKASNPDNIVILDVRTPEEYAEGHLPGAVNLDWLNPEAFAAGAADLNPEKHYYVYCRSGRRSLEACQRLAKDGLKVTDLAGGILAWQSAHLPTTTKVK